MNQRASWFERIKKRDKPLANLSKKGRSNPNQCNYLIAIKMVKNTVTLEIQIISDSFENLYGNKLEYSGKKWIDQDI